MVFIFILISALSIVLLLIHSTLKVEITNLKFNSILNKKINEDYILVFTICILNKIPILKKKVTKQKSFKIKVKEKIEIETLHVFMRSIEINKELLDIIKKIKMKVEKIDFKLELGTQDSASTSFLVAVISGVVGNIFGIKLKKTKNKHFIINPIYINQNLINIEFSGIFKFKLYHIINTIYLLKKKEKKGVEKYERTSNRRSYGYSYEQH